MTVRVLREIDAVMPGAGIPCPREGPSQSEIKRIRLDLETASSLLKRLCKLLASTRGDSSAITIIDTKIDYGSTKEIIKRTPNTDSASYLRLLQPLDENRDREVQLEICINGNEVSIKGAQIDGRTIQSDGNSDNLLELCEIIGKVSNELLSIMSPKEQTQFLSMQSAELGAAAVSRVS